MSESRLVPAAPRRTLGLSLVLTLVLTGMGLAGAARAQAPIPSSASSAPLVRSVRVEGAAFTDTLRILRTFELRAGQEFAPDLVRRGVKKLTALGLFSNVVVNRDLDEASNALDLVIVVTERPRIAGVVFEGQRKREEADLERKLFLKAGEVYSPRTVANQSDTLRQYYRDEGFARARVEARTDSVPGRNEVTVRFVIDEGEKVRITAIRFEGLTAFPEKRLRKVMKTKAKGFLGGGDLKDETFAEDREKLEAWFHDHGHRDMTVVDFRLEPGALPRDLLLVVTLEEGPSYRQGAVSWSGNTTLSSATLQRLWPRKGGDEYNRSRITRTVSAAYGEYAEKGFLYLSIEPRETVSDSVVDVEIAVNEGSPSNIRRVSITGNKGTREHVIRREINIREGDRFRRSALIRSQSDVMRLGIFSEVIPDFAPAESTDVDLVFKITEKQVGTASAGAGFTNESGVTGFLEIGHNNVLGNGQQLQLHLERGGRREDYQLSFTEPWFRGTPTLLGFSAYNTFRSLQEFDQKRRGLSARIGRPLPWPDYSRGSVSYTFEGLKISEPRIGVVPRGITLGKEEFTSTIETNFLRNSTDNPFYPTHGTRLSVNDEFTGGVLGGDLAYHRHRLEGRAYLPSVFKSFTTMVRLRVGSLHLYPWMIDPNAKGYHALPDYARFRLGGGNTLDPLRGYDDYQVVPGKFVTDVERRTFTGIDTVSGDSTFRTTTSRVRYPGGRFLALFTTEQQFPIAHPLHGLFFLDAGGTWDEWGEIRLRDLKLGAGVGFRMEIPLLGNIGFDYGYGFQRDDGPKWTGHFMLGNMNF